MLLKTAIIRQILRVFVPPGTRDMVFWLSNVILWINALAYLVLLFMTIFACRPISKFWNILLKEGRCLDSSRLEISAGVINVVTDVVIFCLPQWVIWRLCISDWRRKARLMCVFCAAAL